MSLRTFHLFFIGASALLSLFLLGWGIYDFKVTGESLGLGLSLLGAAGVALLTAYYRWFRQKYSKLTPLLAASGLFCLSITQSRWASACATCFVDPDSPLTKGALMGVLVLALIIVGVLAGIVYIAYSWHKRARLLSTHL